jgi:fatty-acyl-CoA synthase
MSIASLADIQALERVPFREHQPADSVFHLLMEAADRYEDRPAMRFLATGLAEEPVRDISFRDVKRQTIQAANFFRSLGVEANHAVSFLLPILPETFIAMFGAQVAGVANPINFLLEVEHIVSLLQEANCRVLLGPDPDLFPSVWLKIQMLRHAVPSLRAIVRVGGPPKRSDDDALHFESEIANQSGENLTFDREFRPDDIASLFHTGGTTSIPKLVRQTQRGLLMQCWSNAQVSPTGPEHVYFNGLPPFHIGGTNILCLMPLVTGTSTVLLTPAGYRNPIVISNIWALVERFRPTVLVMVPTSWGAALNVPVDGHDISSVILCQSGGAAMPVALAEAVESRLKVPFAEGWGMTEVHGFGSMNPVGEEGRIGSVGLRTPFTEIIAAHVARGRMAALCRTDEIGHILVRGHQLFAGYVKSQHDHDAWIQPAPDEQVPEWSPGGRWFDTGDLGRLDAEGYLWLTGRAKDIIIRGAHNIDPLVIEEAIHQHPAIEAAAAVGRPDAYAGELPVLFVQLKSGSSATEDEIEAFARQHVPERAALPVEIILIDRMPLTGVGKIFKPELRYIAARLVFERLITPLAEGARRVDVSIGPDTEFGTLATVTIDGPISEAQSIAVKDALSRFQLRSRIVINQ